MGKLYSDLPEQCCLECHFLVSGNDNTDVSCDKFNRDKYKNLIGTHEDDSSVMQMRSDLENICCNKEVWRSPHQNRNEAVECMKAKEYWNLAEQLKQTRLDCFFFPYSQTLSLKSAAELERLAANRREAEKDRALAARSAEAASQSAKAANKSAKTAKCTFWLTVIALIVNIILTIFFNFFHTQKNVIVPSYDQNTQKIIRP